MNRKKACAKKSVQALGNTVSSAETAAILRFRSDVKRQGGNLKGGAPPLQREDNPWNQRESIHLIGIKPK